MSVRTFFVRAWRTLAATVLLSSSAGAGAQVVTVPSMSFSGQPFAGYPGDLYTTSAYVTNPSPPDPTGTVKFELADASNATVLQTYCPASVLSGSPSVATCSYSLPTTPGTYYLRGTYSGDGVYTSQAIAGQFTVYPYDNTVAITGTPPSPALPGSTYAITGQVSSTGPAPPGTISMTLYDPSSAPTLICANKPLDAAFSATCPLTVPSVPGEYRILVEYNSSSPVYNGASNSGYFTVPYRVTSTAGSGPGSLGDALSAINAACTFVGKYYTIMFAISGAGPHTIAPTTALPEINCPNVTIDGFSQPGAARSTATFGSDNASLQIILNGSGCTGCNGLVSNHYGTVLQGLAIRSFPAAAVVLNNGGNLTGNYIGTDPGGMTGYGNGAGIIVNGGYFGIGQTDPGYGNVITASAQEGIFIGASATGDVSGNIIGGVRSGGSGAGNGVGVMIYSGSVDIRANAIRYNQKGAVVDATVSGAFFTANAAHDNNGPGIDLNNDGMSPNDDASAPYDQDTGANGTQNYPNITSVTYDGTSTRIVGELRTDAPSSAFGQVELYSNTIPRIAPTGGENFVGGQNLDFSAGTGVATFDVTVAGRFDNVSALATVNRCGIIFTDAPKAARTSLRTTLARAGGCPVTSEYSPTVSLGTPVLNVSYGSVTSFVALVGTNSSAVPVTLTNGGTATLTFGAIGVTGNFSETHASCTTLAPSQSCTVNITFTPTATGTRTGQLSIASDAPGSPYLLALTGWGAQPPDVLISTAASPTAGSSTTVGVFIRNVDGTGGPTLTGVDGAVQVPTGYTVNSGLASACGASNAAISGNFVSAVGATIPTSTGCNIAVANITAPSTPGVYTFTIPAGAIKVTAPFAWTNAVAITSTVTVSATPITVSVSPTSLSFGSQATGTTSASRTITVSNSGRAPAPLVMTAITGPFTRTTNCGTAVPVTGCTILVSFAPTALGAATGGFTISAGGGTFTVSLSGTGVAPPAPISRVSPPNITFAPRTVGTVSPASTVTLSNIGNADLVISGISTSGDFQFVSACPASLTPAATCDIDVKFAPVIAGTRGGWLEILSNAASQVVLLGGTGLSIPIGTLSVSDSLVEFDATPVGGTSATVFVGIGNSGSANLSLSSALSGPFAFGVLPSGLSACPPVIAPGDSCSIALVFKPTTLGTASGALSLTSNGSNPRVDVVLVGAGSPALPTRALSVPARVDFGSIAVGVTSAARTVTLANNTAQVVAIRDIAVSGDFAAADGCATVPARGSCALNVTFKPTVRGDRIGSLVIRTAAETEAYAIALAGTGEANPIPQLEVHPTSVGFGNSLLGPLYGHEPVELVNVGEVPVALGGMSAQADFVLDNRCGATLEVGARCTVFVSFYPRVAGSRTGTLSIGSNAAGTPHLVNLSGTGCTIPSVPRGRTPALVCAP